VGKDSRRVEAYLNIAALTQVKNLSNVKSVTKDSQKVEACLNIDAHTPEKNLSNVTFVGKYYRVKVV
jgi:hypothetical protein